MPAGTTVHDQATVTGGLGTPTGTVTFSWFTNGDVCGGPAVVTSGPFTLEPAVWRTRTTFAQTPLPCGDLRVPGDLFR